MATITEADKKRGKWVPWIFVALFAVVFTVDGIFVYMASTTFTGLSTEHAYEKGLAYNDSLAREEAQKALGWVGDVNFVHEDDLKGRMTFTLKNAKGEPLAGAKVQARIIRPTQDGHDTALELKPSPGGYSAAYIAPMKGLWDVKIIATYGTGEYRMTERLMIK